MSFISSLSQHQPNLSNTDMGQMAEFMHDGSSSSKNVGTGSLTQSEVEDMMSKPTGAKKNKNIS